MTGPESGEGTNGAADSDDERESLEGRRMAQLLKPLSEASLARGNRDLLLGVQRKIRQRSRGKFYGDGWSTTQTRMSYVLVAFAMLVILVIAYFALGPVGIAPR
jgi:hypothetical protein